MLAWIVDSLNAVCPGWTLEYRFHPKRKFRFDFACPSRRIAVEVEGGVWTYGRHVRGSGYIRDMEKYNLAVMEGWRVLRYTPEQTLNGKMTTDIGKMIAGIDGRKGPGQDRKQSLEGSIGKQ